MLTIFGLRYFLVTPCGKWVILHQIGTNFPVPVLQPFFSPEEQNLPGLVVVGLAHLGEVEQPTNTHTNGLKYHSTCLKPIKKLFLLEIQVYSIIYVLKATYLYKNYNDISIWGKVMIKSGNSCENVVNFWFVLLFCNTMR